MKFLVAIIFISFFLSCSKGEKNDFDKKIKYAYDYAVDPATSDTIYKFMIPNGFTPNADGINDYFYPLAIGAKRNSFEMYIYTRNKNLIFYSDDFHRGWDGFVQGGSNICDMGIYTVDITVTDTLNTSHRYLNYIQLVK